MALIRRSLRGLLRVPTFTAVCVLTLAVGIAAATAIFSVVNGVLLTPLPYAESERLVGLWHRAPAFGFDKLSQSPGTYQFYRQRSRSFEDIALYRATQVTVTGNGTPERLPAGLITPSLFPVLRVKPSLGRAFVAEEGRPGAAPVVLLSDRLWRRRFAADPRALGRSLRINGVPRAVVGVMPAGFEFPRAETELWLPLEVDPAQARFGDFGPSSVARLRPGITPAAAQAELDRLLAGDEATSELTRDGFRARVLPLREDVVGDIGRTLWILLGAVGFILLIACANVSNLLIVRGEGRRRETAIHTALGASPRQLIGIVLLESLLLAAVAGVLGLLLAAGGLRLLLKLAPLGLPRLEEIGIDGRVLLFTAAAAVLSSLLAGLFPALRSLLKGDLALELKTGGTRSTSGHAQRRMRRFLVGLQVGLVLVLLTGSGLMLRSFLRLSHLDPGFATQDVLTFQLSLPEPDFPDDAAAAGFLDRVVERLRGLPGVRSAGVASTLPLSGSAQASGHVIEDQPPQPGAPPPNLWFGYAGEGYFEALGVPLLAGRTLTRADQENRAGVAMVNQALARHFWPRGDALGKRLRPATNEEGGSEPWYTIVGIVGDVRNRDLVTAPDEIVYYPLLGPSAGAWTVRQANVVLRTRVAPESLASAVRSAVWSVDPNVPVSGVQPMEQILRRSRARMIYAVLMLVLATAVAMVLAAVGIYGFVSYVVSQRTAEVGVRKALGAHARDIRWLILRESLAIALAGILVGLLGAVALTRWLGSLLFEISPLDPLTFTAMPLLLLAIVLLSSALPAERAARVDPLKALKFS
ncbi:MAG TPA: ABC transporter permease [Thermoanaerobaculia bacterium]